MQKFMLMLLLLLSGNALALNDPTRPAGYPVKPGYTRQVPGWNVSSIRIAAQSRSAVINGQHVSVGNRVNGATVIRIEPASVRLKKDNKEFSVRLFSHNVQKKLRN